jgi:hypothetical protein
MLACALSALAAFAQDEEDHAAHHPDGNAPQAAETGSDHAGIMAQGMRKMQESREQMQNAKTPEERRQAIQAHRQSMRELMEQMDPQPERMAALNEEPARGEKGKQSGKSMRGMPEGKKKTPMAMMDEMPMMDCMMGKMMEGQKKNQARIAAIEHQVRMIENLMRNMIDNEDAEQELEGR